MTHVIWGIVLFFGLGLSVHFMGAERRALQAELDATRIELAENQFLAGQCSESTPPDAAP
jgi:hypothetical protein